MNSQKFFLSFFLIAAVFGEWPFAKKLELGPATFSPDGQYLVFSIGHKGRENIYRVKEDGTELTELTASPGWDFDPVYSPDGSRIAFARISSPKSGQDADLWIMNSDGSNQIRLTTGPAHDTSPVFSPDGQRIYFVRAKWFGHHSPFVSSQWHDMDLCSVKIDGADLKQITDGWYYEISRPSVSPDGKHILVRIWIDDSPDSFWLIPVENPRAMRSIRPNLERYAANQAEKPWATELVKYDHLYYPQLSPDGKSLLFKWSGHYQGYFGHEIYVTDLETLDTRKVTDLKSYIRWPSFSPDGKEIVFLCDRKGTRGPYGLWVVNVNGSDPRRIDIKL